MKPLYIFDLDGTLALIEHRRHLAHGRRCHICLGNGIAQTVDFKVSEHRITTDCATCNGKGLLSPDWPAFYAACVDDLPNLPVITTLVSIVRSGAEVWIWSARGAEVMNETRTWLQKHLPEGKARDNLNLTMRLEGDYTPDDELKASWLDGMPVDDRERLVAVFDDRDKVVAMWRSKGVACFQVAQGAF